MAEEKEEKKEKLDPDEMIEITRGQFRDELYKAQENGSQIKYMVLGNFLFAVCEFFADSFKPPNAPMDKFLGFTLYTLEQEYKKKYQLEVKDEENGESQPVQGSKEATKGRHKDVPEGSEGRQEAGEEAESQGEEEGKVK